MRLIEKDIRKKVKLPTGVEVKRLAKLRINLPETQGEAEELLINEGVSEEIVALWAAHGMLAHAKIVASNRLLGAAGDKSLKKSLRQFKESLRTMVDVMEMEAAEAVTFLLGKAKFKTVAAHFEAIGAGAEVISVDFTTEDLPMPKWFTAEDEDDETDEDEVTE